MSAVPRWFVRSLVGAVALYSAVSAIETLGGPDVVFGAVALLVFLVAVALGLTGYATLRVSRWRASAVAACAVVLPPLGSVGLDPQGDSYGSGSWYVAGTTALVLLLVWRGREALGWLALAGLVLQTFAWSGFRGLNAFGVVAAVLMIAVLAAGGWALRRTEGDLERYSAAEREALDWRAEQDAYESVRGHRLRETARVGGPMLRRIVETGGRLSAAERFEARVLEQTVRDEIRGRNLLNDAVREQVLRLRRTGAVVQVNDDGGLDGMDPVDTAPLLDRVAAALAELHSDRVIIRTAPADSAIALSVAAMSSDPVAAALGLDDEDEQVDLWLELPRPGRTTRAEVRA